MLFKSAGPKEREWLLYTGFHLLRLMLSELAGSISPGSQADVILISNYLTLNRGCWGTYNLCHTNTVLGTANFGKDLFSSQGAGERLSVHDIPMV